MYIYHVYTCIYLQLKQFYVYTDTVYMNIPVDILQP